MPPMSKEMRRKSQIASQSRGEDGSFFVSRILPFTMFFLSFSLPNLVFSGSYFFSTLHLMKWVATLAPIALLGVVHGFRTARLGAERTGFRLDGFAFVWLMLLLYVTAQPLWTDVRSMVTFAQEWFFFASLWLVYVLASYMADERLLRALLWGALLNAAISVLFAELQMRGLNGPYPFVMPTPGNYIANTGQQNMFALWMAIGGLGGAFLLLSTDRARKKPLLNGTIFALLGVVFRGLITSTSRSGILALAVGYAVLAVFYLRLEGRRMRAKVLFVPLLFAAVLAMNVSMNDNTAQALTNKLEDVIERPLSIAHRDSIWATSWTMFSARPWRGTGLGQFKWNYMDAQVEMLHRWPHLKWQYTHWAHNEFLQWMAEAGVVGAALMFFLWIWWGWGAMSAFVRKTRLSPGAVWGSALVSLFFFNALWTRPFHRIENAVWLALAFAATNREVLPPLFPALSAERFSRSLRVAGGVICVTSLVGLIYLGNGVYGDRMLRLAAGVRGDAAAMQNYLTRAYNSPMVRDEAEMQLAYLLVHLGDHLQDPELTADGLNALIAFFEKQPDVQELSFLRRWVPRLNNEGFKRYVESFTSWPNPSGTQLNF